MTSIKNLAASFLLTLLLVSPLLHAGTTRDKSPAHLFVVTGVVVNSHSATLIRHFSNYLATQSHYPLTISYADNYTQLSHLLRANPDAIGWTCGAPFVQDSKADGQQLIAVPLFKKSPTYYSVILSRRSRPEKSLTDFKGQVLAYSDPRSNSGYLSPKYSLYKKGLDMPVFFRLLLNAGSHEGSIDALINGLADVAAVDEYIWVTYQKRHPSLSKKLHEIERMGPYPFTPIVAGRGINKKTINKLASILENMSQTHSGKQILEDFLLDGFVKKNADFYQPIQSMLKTVKIKTGY